MTRWRRIHRKERRRRHSAEAETQRLDDELRIAQASAGGVSEEDARTVRWRLHIEAVEHLLMRLGGRL